MLKQDINLYRHFEAPRTSNDLLTWKRYWILNFTAFMLFIFIYFISVAENAYTRSKEKTLKSQLASYQAEFKKLKNALPQLFFKNDVHDAVKSMQAELAAQKEIMSILSRHEPFSEVLKAFSRNIVPDLWLTNIIILKNGDQITIKGNSIGNNVDDFIAKVTQDKYLANFKIQLSEVKNKDVTSQDDNLNFEIIMTRPRV